MTPFRPGGTLALSFAFVFAACSGQMAPETTAKSAKPLTTTPAAGQDTLAAELEASWFYQAARDPKLFEAMLQSSPGWMHLYNNADADALEAFTKPPVHTFGQARARLRIAQEIREHAESLNWINLAYLGNRLRLGAQAAPSIWTALYAARAALLAGDLDAAAQFAAAAKPHFEKLSPVGKIELQAVTWAIDARRAKDLRKALHVQLQAAKHGFEQLVLFNLTCAAFKPICPRDIAVATAIPATTDPADALAVVRHQFLRAALQRDLAGARLLAPKLQMERPERSEPLPNDAIAAALDFPDAALWHAYATYQVIESLEFFAGAGDPSAVFRGLAYHAMGEDDLGKGVLLGYPRVSEPSIAMPLWTFAFSDLAGFAAARAFAQAYIAAWTRNGFKYASLQEGFAAIPAPSLVAPLAAGASAEATAPVRDRLRAYQEYALARLEKDAEGEVKSAVLKSAEAFFREIRRREAYYALARGDTLEAIRVLEDTHDRAKANTVSPNNPRLLFARLARCYMLTHNYVQAKTYLNTLLPEFAPLTVLIGQLGSLAASERGSGEVKK